VSIRRTTSLRFLPRVLIVDLYARAPQKREAHFGKSGGWRRGAVGRRPGGDCAGFGNVILIASVVSNHPLRRAEPSNKQGQIETSEEPWISDGRRYAFCLRRFFVDGYKTPVVDELKRSGYFCPKNIWGLLALNFRFGHCNVD
jgi:hypothetical protein